MTYEETEKILNKYEEEGILKKIFLVYETKTFAYKDKHGSLGYGHYVYISKDELLEVLNSIAP